ncbi:hypothetical protein [Mycoplasma nasistruthionis]|uniref:Uncharacterized protein n=1 Tax=Mycoplasma nasistruthionis TaxID=353852 RepID=A0A5B7XWH9_9MOLU|nr:hypothetical protein [Mycoplasma nasistruthionis]QCZ36855.1 hypothetical protein FG904_02465 [Mycoplasma nasistruthionis]
MIQLFYETTQSSSSSNSNSNSSAFVEFLEKALGWLPHHWALTAAYILLALLIAFVFGFFWRTKWIISKVIIYGLTVGIAATFYFVIKGKIDNDQSDHQILAFSTTLVALSVYIVLKLIFSLIVGLVSLIRIPTIKLKKISKIKRLLTGIGNVAVSIPGVMLIANITLTNDKGKERDFLEKTTNLFGVKPLTVGQGASVSGLGYAIRDIYKVIRNDEKLIAILQKPAGEWTSENKKDLQEAAESFAALLNNNNTRSTAISILKKTNLGDDIVGNSNLKEYITLADVASNSNPQYITGTPEQKKAILTNNIIDVLKQKITDYTNSNKEAGVIDASKYGQYIRTADIVAKNLNDEAKKDLVKYVSGLVDKSLPDDKDKFDSVKVMQAAFDEFQKIGQMVLKSTDTTSSSSSTQSSPRQLDESVALMPNAQG